MKPQYVEQIAKSIKGQVGALLLERKENDNVDYMIDTLGSYYLSPSLSPPLSFSDDSAVELVVLLFLLFC